MQNNDKKKINFKNMWSNFLGIFIIFNIFLFAGTIPHNVIGSPYPVGRMFMNAAGTINMVYLNPVPCKFAAGLFHNTLYAPVFALRDGLFNIGLKFIPRNDLEREVWWGKIEYFDYMNLFHNGDITYSSKESTIIAQRELNQIEKKYGVGIKPILELRKKSTQLLTSDQADAYYDYKYSKNDVNVELKKLQVWSNLIDEHIAECQKPNKILKDKKYQIYLENYKTKLLSDYPLVRKKYYYITYGKAEGSIKPSYLYKFKGEIEKLKKYYQILKPYEESERIKNEIKWTDENNSDRANIELVSYWNQFEYLDPILLSDYKSGKFSCNSEYYKDYLIAYEKMNDALKKPRITIKGNYQHLQWMKQVSDMDKNYKLFTSLCK